MTCKHSIACRTFYNFKKGEPTNKILEGGYFENDNLSFNEDAENIRIIVLK